MSAPLKPKPLTSSGPQPKTFDRWVRYVCKRGAKRFRAILGDGTQKILAHKTAADTARRLTKMAPASVEALDDKDAELGDWTFHEIEPEEEPAPGYEKEEGDTEQERVLKTFAHLLADAHKLASRQLVEVVSIQSQHFAEERKNLLSQQMLNERLWAKRLRLPPRLRVAADGEEGGEEGGEGEGEDTFLQEMIGPLLQRMVAKHVADGVGVDTAQANGAADAKEGKS